MSEFRMRCRRIKPCLWLGCEVSEIGHSPSGRAVMLRFSNFPWAVCLDKMSALALTTRKFGDRMHWPKRIDVSDIVPLGTLLNIQVSSVERDGQVYISSRIVLGKE